MRYTLNTRGAAAATAALVLTTVAAAGVAHARPAQPTGLHAPSAMVLTVGKGEAAATSTVERAVTLSCIPTPGGSHPAPAAACGELDAVNGEFGRLSVKPTKACTRQWDPVTVTASGVWQGKRVDWSATYGNACEMQASMPEVSVYTF
ncbi:subtilase-type protease inhibitor [Streptomyces sp. NPDC000410]|uniref:subtilase-type protease inhibitor n=1 Tax=Streptomyces sp. NPDC000410 TaxID=3154254 RepID=UPI00332F1D6C